LSAFYISESIFFISVSWSTGHPSILSSTFTYFSRGRISFFCFNFFRSGSISFFSSEENEFRWFEGYPFDAPDPNAINNFDFFLISFSLLISLGVDIAPSINAMSSCFIGFTFLRALKFSIVIFFIHSSYFVLRASIRTIMQPSQHVKLKNPIFFFFISFFNILF
jgi:hypothetical protein